MSDLSIRVGDLHFSARWEPDAPRTIEIIRAHAPPSGAPDPLPLERRIDVDPVRRLRPDVGWENHTSHPAPGHLAMYPGGISECEIFFPYGACTTSSKVGQLAANHFASILPDEGWEDRLREVGRRCLWDGAQDIEIVER